MGTDPQSEAAKTAAEIPDNPVEEQLDQADAAEVEHADEVVEGIEASDAHAADAGPDELAD